MAVQFNLAHDLDAGWLVALWLLIHGCDPAPEGFDNRQASVGTVAASAIASLAVLLDEPAREAVTYGLTKMRHAEQLSPSCPAPDRSALLERLLEFGIEVLEQRANPKAGLPRRVSFFYDDVEIVALPRTLLPVAGTSAGS
ncbi:MAG: hypothetical protein ACLPYS_18860 [Vulcanimicrobiaceae bacterium]|jgi:hypothetical protein